MSTAVSAELRQVTGEWVPATSGESVNSPGARLVLVKLL